MQTQKEASEDERTAPADEAKAPEGQTQVEIESKGKEGSRTVPMPAGDETAGNGTLKEAAEEKPVAHGRAGKHKITGTDRQTGNASMEMFKTLPLPLNQLAYHWSMS